jgi:MFS family permease
VLFAATFTPLVFLQPYLHAHGVGTENLGFWQAPVRAVGIVSALGAYRFVSRLGQRGAFFALPVMLVIANLALAGIDSVWVYAAFLPMGMVAGMQNPVVASYVNRRIASERRATVLSVQSVVGSMLLAISQPLGGVVADQFGLRAVFLTFGTLTTVLGTAIFLLWLRAEQAELAGQPEEELLLEPAGEPVAVS